MVGLFLLLVLNAKKISEYLKENVEVSVLFKPEVSGEKVMEFKRNLEAVPEIKSVTYIDKATAAKNFEEELGQEFVETIGYNPLSDALVVRFHSDFAQESTLIEFKQRMSGSAEVREVVFQRNLLDQINSNVQVIGTVILLFSVVFLLISVALINSTIRLNLYSKRFLIKTMQLVGATRWFIIRPIMMRSVAYGLYGALIAYLFLAALIYALYSFVPFLWQLLGTEDYLIIVGTVLLLGILLTFVSSYFASRKYLKLKIEDLY